MVQVPDEEFINGIAATFETDPIARPEVSQLFCHARGRALPPSVLVVGYAFINFAFAVLALVPAQAYKILGFLPKKALWSTCGRLGWSKAGQAQPAQTNNNSRPDIRTLPRPDGTRASQDQSHMEVQ
ncbi:hypothetical protein Neosp_005352 [[Neocosmospora] mangrovei]